MQVFLKIHGCFFEYFFLHSNTTYCLSVRKKKVLSFNFHTNLSTRHYINTLFQEFFLQYSKTVK